MNNLTNIKYTKYKIFVFFTICFLLFTSSLLIAQDTWIQTYSPFYIGDGWYEVEDVIVCQDGDYAVNGTYVEYDSEMGIELAHWGFLMKTDCNGNLLWVDADTVSFMSENESLAFLENEDGDFLSAGSSPWSSYLLKRNSEGNRLWSIFNNFHVESMCRTEDGNIILGGVTTDNGYPGIRKINQEAEVLWSQDFFLSGSGIGRINSIIQTSDGGFAATGYTSGNGFDLFILKTNAEGDSLWCVTIDGYGQWDSGYCIVEDNYTNLMISGKLDNPNTIGFLLFINVNGEIIWTQEINGHNPFSVLSLSDDTFIHYCYIGSNNTSIYKFDFNYNIIWESVISSNVAVGDRSIRSISNGGFICGLRNVISSPNIGLAKLDSNGQVTSTDEYVIHNVDYKLSNYPNPFNPSTSIQFTLPTDVNNPVVEIFNIKGQLIEKLPILNNQLSVEWFADKNATGLYLYRINSNNYISETKKMTIIK